MSLPTSTEPVAAKHVNGELPAERDRWACAGGPEPRCKRHRSSRTRTPGKNEICWEVKKLNVAVRGRRVSLTLHLE